MINANFLFINLQTLEAFDDYESAYTQYIEEYDGGDDTNSVDFWDIYELWRIA